MKKSALLYYLTSFKNIFKNFNFWVIPLIFFKPVKIKVKNHQFFVRNLMDIWTIKEVVFDNCYQKFKKIKKNDVVIDVGASIGDFSILAEKQVAKKIYAIEMDKKAISFMKKNIKLNKAKNIIIFNKKINSLNYIFKKNKIKTCDFLKIDCEGSEYKIIKNTSSIILKKIQYIDIAFEIHLFNKKMGKNYLILKNKLLNSGFRLKEIENPVHNYLKFLFAENVKRKK